MAESLAEHERILIRSQITYAPRDPGFVATDLIGWTTPTGNVVCAFCAGRILARGCSLPRGSTPVWVGTTMGDCCAHSPEA